MRRSRRSSTCGSTGEQRFPRLHRLSDHFLSLDEWIQISRRADEYWIRPGRKGHTRTIPTRSMAMSWWVLSAGCRFIHLTDLRPAFLRNMGLMLLPEAWKWLDRWFQSRRQGGKGLLPDTPLFCTTKMSRTQWPSQMTDAVIVNSLHTTASRLNVGRLSSTMIYPLIPSYVGAMRSKMPEAMRKKWDTSIKGS